MMDRQSELDAFKKLNLSIIASAFGYEIDRKRSTRSTVMMKNGERKIAISQQATHYIYWSVHDEQSNGTVIDFIQREVEPGCSLGRVRQLLRPFLGESHMATIQQQYVGRYVQQFEPQNTDLAGVAKRYVSFQPITDHHDYLSDVRGIPAELLSSERLQGCLRHSPRWGSVVFPHHSGVTDKPSEQNPVLGYEIKGKDVSLFSKGGKKGLWTSRALPHDYRLAVAESGIDALSYLALQENQDVQVVSLAGRMNPQQPGFLLSLMDKLKADVQVVSAFDNDPAGDELTNTLAELVKQVGRSDLMFVEDRPRQRGADWNEVLLEQKSDTGQINAPGP